MPHSDFGPTGAIAVQPSKILFCWITVTAAVAAALCVVYLPMAYGLGAGVVCAAAALYYLRRHALLTHPRAIASLDFGDSGFTAHFRNSDLCTSPAGPYGIVGFVSPWLIVVGLRGAGWRARQTIVLLPDSLPPDPARHLRLWLRWARDKDDNPDASG
jgi:hypothetical protein